MSDHREHTRRIAKNTLMLYIRMFFMMFLGLFTSRIVLEALGENDYGIYNVVGGVVAMFTIISGALSTAVSRFITYEMGKGIQLSQRRIYSAAVTIMILLSLLIVLLAEPSGIWFIENKMTIAPDRIQAAKWVLHFSLLSFVINLMSVPQMATITAHEKMSAYAYIGILDGVLRFSVALIISHASSDRLVIYAMLMTISVLVVRLVYGLYCRIHFPECRYVPKFDRSLFKDMFSFAGWSFIGAASGVLRDQGGNILVNIFSGPAVNAARCIAVQLNGVVQSFVNSFMTAVNPQITKSYAAEEYDYTFSLVRKSSRMSYYLLFILALPVLLNTEFLVSLWLKEVPSHAVSFIRLFLILTLSESLSSPLITLMLATGNIRNYQIVVGGLQLLNIPVSYVLLRAGFPPEVTVAVAIIISQLCFVFRLIMLNRMTGLQVKSFLNRVYVNVLLVTVAALPVPMVLGMSLGTNCSVSLMNIAVCMLMAGLSILFVGCSRKERGEVMSFISKKLKHDQD